MTNTVSIPYERDGNDVVGFGSYRILETFAGPADEADDPVLEDIRRKVMRAMEDFPELTGKTVTVGRLDPDEDVLGQAQFWNLLIKFPVESLTSWRTVYHELAHLAIHVRNQRGEDVPPTSEPFCSIVGISRMPIKLIDDDRISYLGRPDVPREEWPEICQRALEYREERGANSHYIQQCCDWLEIDDRESRNPY
ncbi:hypothetical protein [Natrinema thermotolerans]|uniref:hypothetical protein n=1 Tax=Natrinema thermotolerans TaxID=121872 RepID=UPI0006787ADD|nr:hypothetical protein [Natrinema thermotolerans]QCC57352.1 hypothetical protein DVR14_01335 [Natrinema thermotolerans]